MHKTRAKHHAHYDLHRDLDRIKSALFNVTHDVKGKAGELLSHSIDNMKETGAMAQDKVGDWIVEKPFKSLGIAMLTGMFIGWFLHK